MRIKIIIIIIFFSFSFTFCSEKTNKKIIKKVTRQTKYLQSYNTRILQLLNNPHSKQERDFCVKKQTKRQKQG